MKFFVDVNTKGRVELEPELKNSQHKAVTRSRHLAVFLCPKSPFRLAHPRLFNLRGRHAYVQGFGLKAWWLHLVGVLNPRRLDTLRSVFAPVRLIATQGALT